MSDIQRTEKDTTSGKDLIKRAKDIDIFGQDVFLTYVIKKTERLTSGVHIVTRLWTEGEPLRTSLRNSSLALVHLMSDFRSDALPEEVVHTSVRRIGEMLSLIGIAASARLLPEENASILEDEYRRLASLLLERAGQKTESSFSQTFFEVGDSAQARSFASSPNEPYLSRFALKPSAVVTTGSEGGRRTVRPLEIPKLSPRDESRRNEILSVIRSKGKVTIRDVAGVITDCSEKTIQRELAAMVAEGLLKREGERRWSTYQAA